jgi:adenine C2-methylase RlmN of 23S rRNA A2503 and tRNA A37
MKNLPADLVEAIKSQISTTATLVEFYLKDKDGKDFAWFINDSDVDLVYDENKNKLTVAVNFIITPFVNFLV